MYTLYLIAIVAEAMSGALMGIQRGMDRFGLAFVGSVTALGGGTLRDLLLDHHPVGWIAHPEYIVITLIAATMASATATLLGRMKQLFVTVDALGLAAFAVIGCDIGVAAGQSFLIIVISGAITGIGGGMLRDLLCNEIPIVLREELYASVAFLTGALYVGLLYAGVGAEWAAIAAIGAGFAMRMLSVRFGWRMRKFGPEDINR